MGVRYFDGYHVSSMIARSFQHFLTDLPDNSAIKHCLFRD